MTSASDMTIDEIRREAAKLARDIIRRKREERELHERWQARRSTRRLRESRLKELKDAAWFDHQAQLDQTVYRALGLAKVPRHTNTTAPRGRANEG